MPLIDEQGRLFGRINLIDAMVGLFVLVLIPLTYGAFLLFRTPVPTITSVTPAQVTEKQTATLEIIGTNLRPFLRAHLGTVESPGFLVQSPTKAEVKVPDTLPVGTYDLILSDEAREIVRKPAVISIVGAMLPAAIAQVQLLGEFVGLSPELAKVVQAGAALKDRSGDAPTEVLAARPAQPGIRSVSVGLDQLVVAPAPGLVRVPAILRVTCTIVDNRCKVGDVIVAPESIVLIPIQHTTSQRPTQADHVTFRVSAVRPTDTPAAFATASVRVRFVARPEVARSFKVGDSDLAMTGAVTENERASLSALDADREGVSATANVAVAPGQTYQVPQQVVTFSGTLRVPVVSTPSGWQYKGKAVKIGAPFTFETPTGFVQGWIADMTVMPGSDGNPR